MKISNHQMCNEGGASLFIMIAEKQIERSRKEQETNEQGKMRGSIAIYREGEAYRRL